MLWQAWDFRQRSCGRKCYQAQGSGFEYEPWVSHDAVLPSSMQPETSLNPSLLGIGKCVANASDAPANKP
jgi:hypothetical protein